MYRKQFRLCWIRRNTIHVRWSTFNNVFNVIIHGEYDLSAPAWVLGIVFTTKIDGYAEIVMDVALRFGQLFLVRSKYLIQLFHQVVEDQLLQM